MFQTFPEKIPLHRQLPDLSVKLGQLRLAGHLGLGRLDATLKQPDEPVLRDLLPGMHLAGMHPVFARKLGNRAFLPQRRLSHLRLERRAVLLPDILHLYPLGW